MKSKSFFSMLGMAVLTAFIACSCSNELASIEDETVTVSQTRSADASGVVFCGTQTTVDLMAGQNTVAGTVTVGNDKENLYVTYTATGEWKLASLHLYVGAAGLIPVNNGGNPVPGKFPYQTSFDVLASTYTFVIPMEEEMPSVCIAAQADLSRVVSGQTVQTEGAWGKGTSIGGSNWAMKFEYERQTCVSVNPATHTLVINTPGALTADHIKQALAGGTELTIRGQLSTGDWKTLKEAVNAMLASISLTLSEVTAVPYMAFSDCTKLFSISFPKATDIGSYAFRYCRGLTSVSLPSSLTSIGEAAFSNCTGLTSVSLPSSLTSIGNSAFAECTRLASVSLPSLLTSIGNYAFSGCALTEVTLPSSLTSLGNWAFGRCSALTEVVLPASLTSIGESAFNGCALTKVTLPASLTSIGRGVFANCYVLTMVTFPVSLTSIGESAFNGCRALTEVTLPSSLTSIGNGAFANCYGLTRITLPASLKLIGVNAFNGCRGLNSVTFPSSLTSIENYAFQACTALTSVTSHAVTPPALGGYVFYDVPATCTLQVPYASVNTYKAAAGWSRFAAYTSAIKP